MNAFFCGTSLVLMCAAIEQNDTKWAVINAAVCVINAVAWAL